jgi:amino acid transporter
MPSGKGPWLQKPLNATLDDSPPSPSGSSGSYDAVDRGDNSSVTSSIRSIERHLSLYDLVSIGVGGTIGSGIFVICGFIANNFAGPATCLCWIISGIAACLSGVCYAELACRMPSAGSSYVYVFASMGELPAVLVAACLTLEYVVSAAAVARSWGDKMIVWTANNLDIPMVNADESPTFIGIMLNPGYSFNPLAMLVSAASVALLMNGVKESKSVTNFFTVTKVLLVAFMAIMGLILMKPQENLTPFIPPQFGWSGIFRGATSSFFGYIGFDELCCLAGEAIDPQKNMPLSIVWTLGLVTLLYVAASLALTGMQPYQDISGVSGFPVAFDSRGYDWAAQISAFGEVFTLPIVVLISVMAQPRLQYAMAMDGLLPPIFAKVDKMGNLWHGTVISGIIMTIIAAFIPFTHLNDMVSAGILVAFSMTNASLILMRYESPINSNKDGLVEKCLGWFNLCSVTFSIGMTHYWDSFFGKIVVVLSAFMVLRSVYDLRFTCTPAALFGGRNRKSFPGDLSRDLSAGSVYFKTPLLPYIPCLGMFVNWYLVAQLELFSIGLLLGFIGVVAIYYFAYASRHSVGNNGGWKEEDGESEDQVSLTGQVPYFS